MANVYDLAREFVSNKAEAEASDQPEAYVAYARSLLKQISGHGFDINQDGEGRWYLFMRVTRRRHYL